MKILLSLELDNSIIQGIHHNEDGYIVKLDGNQVMFITENKIGLFNNEVIDSVNGDFSKIEISTLHILQHEDFSYDSGATVN